MKQTLATRTAEDDARCEREIDRLLGLDGVSNDREAFKIGDLAREFGVTLRTLRFYEDRGLLRPQRRGTVRLYTRADRTRLKLIQLAKTLGFSLTEAKQLIELYHQPGGRQHQLEVAFKRLQEQEGILLDQQREVAASLVSLKAALSIVRRELDEPSR
jgi:DNA-binding transcriptional MerR regulator